MRHGKSDWDAGIARDFDRPLARRGLEDVPRMSGWLSAQTYKPVRIVSSPARRAATTAQLMAEGYGLDVIHDAALYDARVDDLLATIARHADATSGLMLVGHNPGLDELLEYLVPGELPLTPGGKLITTAAIAVLEYSNWPLAGGSCQLLCLQRPKSLPG